MMLTRRVVSGFKSASGSLLTDGDGKTSTRWLIEATSSLQIHFSPFKKYSEWLYFSCILVVVVTLDLRLGPRAEVHEDADRESCATKIAEELVLLNVSNLLDGLAFHHDISSVSFYHQVHFEIGRHCPTMEYRMMLVFSTRSVSMFIETDLECLLVKIFRHSTAKVLVYCNHASDIGVTIVNQLLPKRL